MGANTKIEWCDHTFNPWYGCEKVSPGCEHCYAEGWAKRSGLVQWGPFAMRVRSRPANWDRVRKWDAEAKAKGIRYRVFCASLADWLDDKVPVEWLADLLDLIRTTPNLDWLLLTKRPANWRPRIKAAGEFIAARRATGDVARVMFIVGWLDHTPPANVWIGTTAEDQKRYDERIGHLCAIPALVRFLSMEPLLSAVNMELDANVPAERMLRWYHPVKGMIHWVIVGGESGPKARPMHPDWAQSIRDQCAVAGVPMLFKQWGEWRMRQAGDSDSQPRIRLTDTGNNGSVFCADGGNDVWMQKVGKSEAGRLLDGIEHNAFPNGGAL